jgi:hypothetical protein
MTQNIIDVGAAANDGTGDPLRNAFQAVNNNFTQIFTAGPVDSNIQISGNTISTTVLNANLVLKANGIGYVQSNSSIVPSQDLVLDIGTANLRFNTITAGYFVGNGALLTGIGNGGGGSGASIANGTSNVSIPAFSGNVTISVNDYDNVAVFTANSGVFNGNLLPAANVTFNLGSNSQAWNDLYLSGNTIYLGNATVTSNATAVVITNGSGGTFTT